MSNSSNPYAAHLRNPIRSDPNLSPSIPTASPSVVSSPALPISTSSSSVELPILQISTMDLNSSSDGGVDWVIQEDGEESPRSSAIPIRPSEKALGKLRKFSVREGSFLSLSLTAVLVTIVCSTQLHIFDHEQVKIRRTFDSRRWKRS